MLSTHCANVPQIEWGEFTMVLAMRLLLRTALLDPMNQRFMFACEKTLPLYPATLVYQQLMGEGKSRVAACPNPEEANLVIHLPFLLNSAIHKSAPAHILEM